MDDYIKLYAVQPFKITEMVRRKKTWFKNGVKNDKKNVSKTEIKKLVKKFHNFELSENSRRNLKKKIEYLFAFSDEKKVKTFKNKVFKFKCAFITLTLSYKQCDPTYRIVEKIFQPFLDRCRKLWGLKNYVYRLEFQRNGNVHFHLVTDCYIDYYELRRVWNECQNYLGYVEMYKNELQSLNWVVYREKFLKNGDYKKCYNDWKSAKNRMLEPNSVDVRVARENTNIDNYIAKYFSKKEGLIKCNEMDNEENSFALRLCFWSRSLSKCKSMLMPDEYYPYNHIFHKVKQFEGIVEKWFDYCKVLYINNKKIEWNFRIILKKLHKWLKNEYGYQCWDSSISKWVIN